MVMLPLIKQIQLEEMLVDFQQHFFSPNFYFLVAKWKESKPEACVLKVCPLRWSRIMSDYRKEKGASSQCSVTLIVPVCHRGNYLRVLLVENPATLCLISE